MNELTISVTIAERPYRLKVGSDEEEIIRKATVEINNKVKSYAENFAFNDKQDLLAMVALEKAMNALQIESKGTEENEKITSELTDIDRKLQKIVE